MNNVTLMGRLTRDVELRYTNSQMAIGRFTVAINRRLTKDKRQQAEDNNQPTVDFISCVAFGKQAETIAQYVSKGMRVSLSGRLQTGSYQNKQGQTVYTTDVVVEQFDFIDSHNQQNNNQGYQPANQQSAKNQQNNQPFDDDLGMDDMAFDEELPF